MREFMSVSKIRNFIMKWKLVCFILIPLLGYTSDSGKQMRIVFLFYQGMNALDVVGPHEILCDLPDAKVIHVATQPGLITTDSGLKFTAEYALSEISYADVLVVPGASSATTFR